MNKVIKVRIYPTPEQAEFLNRQFGAVRFAYNKALHIISSQYKRHGLKLNAKKDLKPLLAVAKKSRKYHWLKEFDSIALQQACINLDKAFQRFFDPKLPSRYPKFKRKHSRQSSYHCMSVDCGDDWIKVPKLKQPIRARIHRKIEGKLKSITLSRTVTGEYYAALLHEDGQEAPAPIQSLNAAQVLGLDMGLTHLAIDSNGTKKPNPRFLKKASANLRRKQRALSRCKKGSKGRAKARLKLAKAHQRLANARADFQHKLSRQLIDESQAVIVETLKVKNMLKNKKLSKHIADASWSGLIQKLEYKSKEQGKHLIKIDQWFASSKICSCCGHMLEELSLSVRDWHCPACSTQHDRDINAALNIKAQGILKLKAAGLSVSANGGKRQSGHAPVAA
ncbi:RNA-guided endonuclease InsQ/TnpB family protein [Aliidiomarina haloalkalitolerans]|uniref:Transposase n=1 Tax=Aliidiomarina haloalkalitolerans TaxID=859059 RepID=A0A432VVE2_9GAMM|nr:RNA-guided endonuclease TnpB family protein [Aliidiomarina haloalkalitolerans]RUO20570.1 transposase [Aliidiomarina haloalkalitolerans]